MKGEKNPKQSSFKIQNTGPWEEILQFQHGSLTPLYGRNSSSYLQKPCATQHNHCSTLMWEEFLALACWVSNCWTVLWLETRIPSWDRLLYPISLLPFELMQHGVLQGRQHILFFMPGSLSHLNNQAVIHWLQIPTTATRRELNLCTAV